MTTTMATEIEPFGSTARARLAQSPLVRAGGFLVGELLTAAQLRDLQVEARQCHQHGATEARVTEPGPDHERGAPDRWLETAPGGPAVRRIFHGPVLAQMLRDHTHVDWSPLGIDGSYSYYRRPGHHLGLHRDILRCNLAVIICIADTDETGDGLVVYPGRPRDPLQQIRQDPTTGSQTVTVPPGSAAVLLGGILPHRVAPIRGRRTRIVSPLCFELPHA